MVKEVFREMFRDTDEAWATKMTDDFQSLRSSRKYEDEDEFMKLSTWTEVKRSVKEIMDKNKITDYEITLASLIEGCDGDQLIASIVISYTEDKKRKIFKTKLYSLY